MTTGLIALLLLITTPVLAQEHTHAQERIQQSAPTGELTLKGAFDAPSIGNPSPHCGWVNACD